MSNFLCGRIKFNSEVNFIEQGEIGFLILRKALDRGFSIQLGANISQEIIFQIVGAKSRVLQKSELIFQFTDSPIMDVAEDLLDNPSVEVLEHIADWIQVTGAVPKVSHIELYFSEGLDSRYDRIEVLPESFPIEVRNLYEGGNGVPSMLFKFSFNSA